MAISMAALDGGRTSIDGAAVDDLSTTIRGDVLKPRDPGYSDHPTFNAMHARHPALIVRCVRLADRALWCSGQARRVECAAQSDFVGGAVLLSLCHLLLRRILPLVLWRWRSNDVKALEVVMLRQALAILRRQTKRPAMTAVDRCS